VKYRTQELAGCEARRTAWIQDFRILPDSELETEKLPHRTREKMILGKTVLEPPHVAGGRFIFSAGREISGRGEPASFAGPAR
jgi:hypothetical protein